MINHDFIHELEGHSLTGYVPAPEISKSGVHISTGYDIGQNSEGDIAAMFFDSPKLAKKLMPYAGLKKRAAVEFLKENPLTITEKEAQKITALCDKKADARLKHRWNNSAADIPFSKLSDEQQTVLASVAYQYGNLESETPKFWGHATNGDWAAGIGELRDFGDAFSTRRNKEADLLEFCV